MDKKNFNPTTLILAFLLIGVAFFGGMMWMKNQDLQQGEVNNEQAAGTPTAQPTQEPLESTLGGFVLTGDEVCLKEGKPSIYYFGGSFCAHCQWEHPIIQKVAKKFGDSIDFHDNMDKLDQDQDIQEKYAQINQGGVPFLVFGCKYARVGSGENYGEADEEKFLTALICKMTNSQPEKVCTPVKDLIDQIK
jgi:thiol-disulfide isomerase/thioredoxin